ncbi:type IV toxin-antitoxin system AbiEi family antitoxin domain-containing protein [uncultured Sphaerochaeta sp.]|uniref:type IV toxin-antitoxin system AbiEi family antitoxin domain-containing protein n=1 Tax=uncultured Sphaerochaeta sp. TaxID=886478 RepID=UPI002A0A51E7|nr:type IV toxin-antitoxin system AbiEi family antitoxin domain-containing protein [uncultured Sphaerochaeta sp.]
MATLDFALPEGLLVDRAWLKSRGIENTTVDYYLRSGKLEAVVHGIYRKPGPPLKWQNVVYSLNLLGYDVHVGHMTALTYHGYAHFLMLGKLPSIRLLSPQRLPTWVEKVGTIPGFSMMKAGPFPDVKVGMTEVPFGTWDWPICYSSPERAFIELTSTIDSQEQILQASLMMDGAVDLRPTLLQELLESSTSIKAKRLFLWLARTAGHTWYQYIDVSKIDLGVGKRQIVPGGKLDAEFLITVPKEAQDGQQEPIF